MTVVVMSLLGGLGAMLRFLVDDGLTRALTRWTVYRSREHPARAHHGRAYGVSGAELATYVVNVVGSFLLGWLAAHAGGDARLLWGVGFCGGFTTFSTASVQVARLALASRPAAAVAHLLAMAVTCLAAAWLGSLH